MMLTRFRQWLVAGVRQHGKKPAPRCRPRLEALEERRLLTDGSLDTTFGNGGKVITALGTDAVPSDLVLGPDGAILVAGQSDNQVALVRYNADGSLDGGFGSGGVTPVSLGSSVFNGGQL